MGLLVTYFFIMRRTLSVGFNLLSILALLLPNQESLRRVLQEKLDAVTKLSDLEVSQKSRLLFCFIF